MARGHAHFSIAPYFKVSDWVKARPLLDECVAVGRTNSCVFFGWTKDGDDLFCNTAFTNADGVTAHLAAVTPLLDALLDGAAARERWRARAGGRLSRSRRRQRTTAAPFRTTLRRSPGFNCEITVGLPQNPLGMIDCSK